MLTIRWRTMRIARARIIALLAVAALLAGCGSYTKRDFAARADAICASTLRDLRSIAPPSFSHAARQQLHALAGYLAQVLPIVQSESNQLRALRRPPGNTGDRAALKRYFAALAQVVEQYGMLAAAARDRDEHGVSVAEAALRASPVDSLAASYGLVTCGTPGATTA